MLKRNYMESNSLLLLLFLHAMLIPSNISMVGMIFSILWCSFSVMILPRLFYYIDRLRISREVSAGIVLLFSVAFAMMFALIERAFFYNVQSDVVMRLVLFVALSVFVGRVENVYESQGLSHGYRQSVLTLSILLSVLLGKFYLVNNVLPILWQYDWIEWRAWSFWQAAGGRLLITTLLILFWQWMGWLYSVMRGERR